MKQKVWQKTRRSIFPRWRIYPSESDGHTCAQPFWATVIPKSISLYYFERWGKSFTNTVFLYFIQFYTHNSKTYSWLTMTWVKLKRWMNTKKSMPTPKILDLCHPRKRKVAYPLVTSAQATKSVRDHNVSVMFFFGVQQSITTRLKRIYNISFELLTQNVPERFFFIFNLESILILNMTGAADRRVEIVPSWFFGDEHFYLYNRNVSESRCL